MAVNAVCPKWDEHFDASLRDEPIYLPEYEGSHRDPFIWKSMEEYIKLHGTTDVEAIAHYDTDGGGCFGRFLVAWSASCTRPFKMSKYSSGYGVTALYVPVVGADTSLMLESISQTIFWSNAIGPPEPTLDEILSVSKSVNIEFSHRTTVAHEMYIKQPATGDTIDINGDEYIRLPYFRPFWPSSVEAMLRFYDTYTIFIECLGHRRQKKLPFRPTDVLRIRIMGDSTPRDLVMYWKSGSRVSSRACDGRYDDMGTRELIELIAHDALDRPRWKCISSL